MSSHRIQAEIRYLGHVVAETGQAHDPNDGRHVAGRYVPRRPTRRVEPAVIEVEVPAEIETVQVSWGDRVPRGGIPSIYGHLTGGETYEISEQHGLRLDGYFDVEEGLGELAQSIRALWAALAEAWRQDVATRPDAAAVVEHYRASVLDALDRQYAEHRRRWEVDAAAIAKRFRRARVVLGEQTVPGLVCVRSTRGNLLGYAECWDGQWLGRIRRAA